MSYTTGPADPNANADAHVGRFRSRYSTAGAGALYMCLLETYGDAPFGVEREVMVEVLHLLEIWTELPLFS
jgi:hypothetical protein